MITLKTERLVLRMLREDDFEQYAAIVADPEVARHLSDGKPLSRADAWRQMAFVVGHWQLRGYGMWAVEEAATGRLAGRIGFLNPEGWPGFELGWTLAPEFWGRGYATEGARRALEYAFTEMGREHVISLIRPDNLPSIRVAERLGERLEGSAQIFGAEARVYGISREEWLARR
ncbi:MAG TPA: GNAT family N-acetyltransferase [Pyrinomonadaceae bacterium]|nr:GNAT family N-acetyltransferase [Pyrinomonadaceae bacterium]